MYRYHKVKELCAIFLCLIFSSPFYRLELSHCKIKKDVVTVNFPDFLYVEYLITKLVPAVVIQLSIIVASNGMLWWGSCILCIIPCKGAKRICHFYCMYRSSVWCHIPVRYYILTNWQSLVCRIPPRPFKDWKKNENLKFKYSTFSYLYNKVVFSFIIYYSYNVMLINI